MRRLPRIAAVAALWVMAAAWSLASEAGMAQERIDIPGPEGIRLPALLFRPAVVSGRAIVALHGCSGPVPSRDRQWGEYLAAQGHPVLFPDSFGARGLGSQCATKLEDRVATEFGLRRRDALAAAAWLARQDFALPGGVVLIGWSNGGSTVLTTIEAGRPDLPPGLLRGAVALYPGCGWASRKPAWQPAVPLLVLTGADDDWTRAVYCQRLAARIAPPRLSLTVYPDAWHDFDMPGGRLREMRLPGETVHAGPNPAARAGALRRVPEFLAELE